MTRNDVLKLFPDATDEQITNLLNKSGEEMAREKEKANQYKAKADKADELQTQLDELQNGNMTELERAQTEKEMKTEALAELLKVRYGIDVQREINLIPMQQLIRIYQRNNPLTINDTRQLLNDTAYSYMVLACTALKLMFKLSVREIEEFITEFRDLIDTLYKFNQFGLTLPKVAQCLADEVNYVDERYIKVID